MSPADTSGRRAGLSASLPAGNDADPNEIPLPFAKKPAGPAMEAPLAPPVPTIGAFFAESRALVDARRAHLGRVGMLPQHVDALRMPDLAEKPLVANGADDLPATPPPTYAPKRLPALPGVNVDLAPEE